MLRRVIVRDALGAMEFVLDHYCPMSLDEELAEQNRDVYAVISMQNSDGGFGFRFQENRRCRGVLTLYVDDIEKEAEGHVLFSREMARQVIGFIRRMDVTDAETLLVHCYGGWSRSSAVGAFAEELLAMDGEHFFKSHFPNRHIYHTLIEEWEQEDDL